MAVLHFKHLFFFPPPKICPVVLHAGYTPMVPISGREQHCSLYALAVVRMEPWWLDGATHLGP